MYTDISSPDRDRGLLQVLSSRTSVEVSCLIVETTEDNKYEYKSHWRSKWEAAKSPRPCLLILMRSKGRVPPLWGKATRMRAASYSLALLAIATLICPAYAAIDFVNHHVIPGEGSDFFDVSSTNYIAGAASTRFGAYFSDLEYDQATGEWYGLADRGPGGGVYPYAARAQVLNIDLNTTTGAIRNITLKRTVPFRNGAAFFDGQSPDRLNGNGSVLCMSFDAEGITVSRTGNLLVSDEYEPAIVELSRTGQFIRRFTQPANIRPTR